MVPLAVLVVVFILIGFRRVGRVQVQIWQAMGLGAVAVLATGQISPPDALAAIDADVMLFLFGMFVIGRALEDSGYLAHLSHRAFRRAGTRRRLLLLVILTFGALSAILMNDTLAIVGTPVVLLLARDHGIPQKPLLLALAFSVTIGSVASPIGNPQNLLIALDGGVENPFLVFSWYLLAPTVINLMIAYLLLRRAFPRAFDDRAIDHVPRPIADPGLARLARLSLVCLVALIGVKVALVALDVGVEFRLTYIALISMLPVLVASPRRAEIVRRADWRTLAFFAGMFVLMESVWRTGVPESAVDACGAGAASVPGIIAIGILMSQLISNVPMVALYLPVLTGAGASDRELMALAAGSTVAGNLLVLGAASNVIIIQNSERRGGATLTMRDFLRLGAPLTLLNALVYWTFLAAVP